MVRCFQDAVTFFFSFISFLKNSPKPSFNSKLYAVCTIDYVGELPGGEKITHTTTLTTEPNTVDTIDDVKIKTWWTSYVYNQVERFLMRFQAADVVHISYHWE